jgi:hypothetical protein
MLTNDFRIARVRKTLRWFEEDVPLLNLRVKELSPERQESARKFAAALIHHTRLELERLQNQEANEEPREEANPDEPPCEPAD